MGTVLNDLRYGLRMLRRNPGFAAVAIVTLALGIGANAAIFSVVDAVLLQPLPYANPGSLAVLWQKNQNGGTNLFPTPSFLAWKSQRDLFSGLAASTASSYKLSLGDLPQRIPGDAVSQSYFAVLGVQPVLGRSFLPSEDVPNGPHVVILSYGLWQRLGGDRSLLGRQLTLDDAGYTVIGVMPPEFREPFGFAELWVPLQLDPSGATSKLPGLHWLWVIGRLKSGVSLAQTQARIDAVAPALAKQYPASEVKYGAALQELTEAVVGNTRPALLILLAGVGLVLAIACVNVVSLLLARAGARAREMAIRAAMGASPRRAVQQSLTEGLLLAVLGGIAALALTRACLPLLVSFGSLAAVPRANEIRMDGRLLLFTALVALAAGLLFSLWPAFETLRFDLTEALKLGGATSAANPRRSRIRSALVVSEVALATVLMTGAGLLVRSFWTLLRVPTGFQSSALVAMKVSVPAAVDQPATAESFRQRLVAAAESVPGVRSAATARDLPYSGTDPSFPFVVEGSQARAPTELPPVRFRLIDPGYFQTMGIPLLRGRNFAPQDTTNSPCVVIVSRSLAQQSWGSADTVGRQIRDGYRGRPACTVIGVVADVKHWLGIPDEATAYYAYSQLPQSLMGLAESYVTVVARTATSPEAVTGELRSQVQRAAGDTPVFQVATMDQMISRLAATRLFAMLLIGAFAALALVLGTVGVYGVLSYSVAQRSREICVRLAIGASPAEVARMVVGQGLKLTLAGLAIGLAGALGLARLLSSQLFGVRPDDPATFAMVAVLLGVVALATSLVPARRATRVDPATALRSE
jgi:putative ABC transport system permease protein